jgi:nitrogen PTS system EIIA component
MRVTIRDAAALLGTSEEKIYDWIESDNLPAQKINDQYRINRSELLEWATAKKLTVSPALFHETKQREELPSVHSALRTGGIYYGIRGATREEILRNIVPVLPLKEDEDREILLHLMLARETLGATGMGNGIAIPHVRNPVVLSTDEPLLTLCFITEPSVDFAMFDGKPVFALFLLICPTIHSHLQMLSRLAYLLRQPEFNEKIQMIAPPEEILETADRLEGQK